MYRHYPCFCAFLKIQNNHQRNLYSSMSRCTDTTMRKTVRNKKNAFLCSSSPIPAGQLFTHWIRLYNLSYNHVSGGQSYIFICLKCSVYLCIPVRKALIQLLPEDRSDHKHNQINDNDPWWPVYQNALPLHLQLCWVFHCPQHSDMTWYMSYNHDSEQSYGHNPFQMLRNHSF